MPEKDEEYLKDQAKFMLRHMEDSTLEKFFDIVYGKPLKANPLEAAALFLEGLRETKFFAYTEFVRKLHGR